MSRKLNRKYSKKAFSLIELIVAMMIISIMVGIALRMGISNKERRELTLAAREIVQLIRQMQNNALTGKMPNSNTLACGNVLTYGISKNAINNGYRLGYVDKSDSPDCNATNVPLNVVPSSGTDPYLLKNDIRFEGAQSRSIYFSIPYGNIFIGSYDDGNPRVTIDPTDSAAELKSGEDPVLITLQQGGAGNLRSDVCICPTGKIEESVRNSSTATNCTASSCR